MNVCPTCHETFGAHLTVCPRDGTLLEGAATQGDRLVGRLLSGRYQVHERVGSGGFGTVYRVTDTHFDDVEALKVFDRKRFDARESEEAMERFAREAKLLRRLGKQTPHIVSVTNFVKDDEAGLFYFTMEYVEGNNLAQILVREGPLELWRAVGFLRQLCEALTIAQSHDPPVVHRDLKLENLMVTADGEEEELRVLDFRDRQDHRTREPHVASAGTRHARLRRSGAGGPSHPGRPSRGPIRHGSGVLRDADGPRAVDGGGS